MMHSIEDYEEFLDEIRDISIDHEDEYDISPIYNLNFEKGFIHHKFEEIEETGVHYELPNVKDKEKSNEIREEADHMFLNIKHNHTMHVSILQQYTESIALAPKNSEELAVSYGHRASFLLHMKIYEDCIRDSDRALEIITSDLTKLKLMQQKINCLIAMKHKSTRKVYDEAVHLLKVCNLDEAIKEKLGEKLQRTAAVISTMTFNEENEEETKTAECSPELPTISPNDEVPCASDAIRVAFNKRWGRHIVANRNIEPGEVLTIEKNYFSFPSPERMYVFCSRCLKSSYSLVPCENCIYDVYCSEECRLDAWERYHQFECLIYPHLGIGKSEIRMLFYHLRCLLISVHKAGGVDQLRDELVVVSQCEDLRKKGFMDDGKFHSDQSRSYLCIPNMEYWTNDYYYAVDPFTAKTCYTVYFLATMTTLFGTKYDLSPVEITAHPEMMFFAGLLLKNFFTLPYNKFTYNVHSTKFESILVGSNIYTFGQMFNHSCWSNADHFINKNNELVIYARHPINKGSQVFINFYDVNFTHDIKMKRRCYFQSLFKFICKCQPCKEQWSNSCLPSIKELLASTPDIAAEVNAVIDRNNQTIKELYMKGFVYTKEISEKLVDILKIIAEKVTVVCKEYAYYQYLMKRMFITSFGMPFIEVPDSDDDD